MRYRLQVEDREAEQVHTIIVDGVGMNDVFTQASEASKKEWKTVAIDKKRLTAPNSMGWTDDLNVKFAVEGDEWNGGPARESDLNPRELAAVIAGLRSLQSLRMMTAGELPESIQSVYTDDESLEGLTDEEIDQLCERLNA